MVKRCLSLIVFGLVMAAWPLSAGESTDSFEMGEIVVTGEKASVADIGISQVIMPDMIEAANSRTLADVLQFAPGISMTRGNKNEPEITVHGFGQEKTLFLIDGIPYNETYYGKLNLDQIPAGMISKVEITKNAPSVLYGANAQIAVINVITKKGTEKPSFSVTGELGQDDTCSTSFSHGNQIGAVNYWLSYMHEESDGWKLSDDFDPQVATGVKKFMKQDGIHEDGGLRENSDYENDRFWGRIGLVPSASSEYFISFHMMDSEFGHPLSVNQYKIFTRKGDKPAFSSFSRFDEYRDWGIDLSGKHEFSDWLTLRGKFFYHDHEDSYLSYDGPDFENVISDSTFKDDYLGGSVFADMSFVDWHRGHFSAHYKIDGHEDRADTYLPYNDYESATGSLGTEHEFITDFGLIVYAGVAYDWFKINEAEDYVYDDDSNFTGQARGDTSDTKDEVNPMIGMTWELDQTKVYGSIARKTRFPSLNQLYSSSSGNPDLEPEESVNYTLGVTQTAGTRITADVAVFYHDISEWISRDYYMDDYSGDDIYVNVEEISMLGFETSLNVEFCDYFKMNFDYTYNNAENRSSNRATGRVAGVPENKFGVGCKVLIPWVLVNLDLQSIYLDEVYDNLPTADRPDTEITTSDDYFILNAKISKKFFDQADLYLEFDNLFDEDYEQEVGFPGRGRNIRGGIKWQF
ncbi:MAG: TonB-dependent receptor [Thermodesulfobacteriota bacterium]|nr:TonB-dependent receptor [Thermodesulfobacteriota bacterium]